MRVEIARVAFGQIIIRTFETSASASSIELTSLTSIKRRTQPGNV